MRKDAAFQIFTPYLADIRLWCGGAVAVERTGTGQLKSGLEVFGYGWVPQCALGVARVVEFGLCTRLARPHENASALGVQSPPLGAQGCGISIQSIRRSAGQSPVYPTSLFAQAA